ncbi:DNA cytosine methyltransferase [Treponema putidum]|uniref:DNA cytosine methyltransferase n=1 Tax=Treponema putidum TaxID=221027 RepID=UPI00210467DF|nr:DNA cytosine methyltransferase [Treponema putidum]
MRGTNNTDKLTYITLFSSAGVGCFGFKMAGYECIATNELIPRRLEIQKFNHKCKYDTGYICGDITTEDTKQKLFSQIDLWKKKENLKRVDVLIATPPCQGMSVANHKKAENEIIRNSLVVESIKIIKEVNPKFFIFENVPAFMKTICTDIDGKEKPISEAIENNLGEKYSYISRVINFKNHGACSSRQRTLVIGVARDRR